MIINNIMMRKSWILGFLGFLKRLVKVIRDVCIIFGIILTAFGVYGLAGGTGIRFFMGDLRCDGFRKGRLHTISSVMAVNSSNNTL